tara:strand:+ start:55 stop:243 length:189 start_codon:yes stop_codon:yes gene_type:complete
MYYVWEVKEKHIKENVNHQKEKQKKEKRKEKLEEKGNTEKKELRDADNYYNLFKNLVNILYI